ncbi:hypothetical protein [Hydrogenophaga sp. NFH-34]|nr:hypothetical protein [Hydrogenophaga sp. NFH-34]
MNHTEIDSPESFWQRNVELVPILALIGLLALAIVAYTIGDVVLKQSPP